MVNKKLVFKDGTVLEGVAFGADRECIGEIIFNTSMFNYQEIACDPTNVNKIVVLTYPIIGNFGVNNEDYETKKCTVAGIVCHEYNDEPSNFRYTSTYNELLEENEKPLLSSVDTRFITRKIRDEGTQIAMIANAHRSVEECIKMINMHIEEKNPVSLVSINKKTISRALYAKRHIVCIDLGTKKNIVKKFVDKKCNVTIVPYDTSYEEILKLNPNGILVTDGPGCPCMIPNVVDTVKRLITMFPTFGTGLGHLVLAASLGVKISKLKVGHHGSNHPVKNTKTGKIEIVTQNQDYACDEEDLKNLGIKITHKNVLNGVVEGFEHDNVITVAYRPECQTCDYSEYLFNEFIEMIDSRKENN